MTDHSGLDGLRDAENNGAARAALARFAGRLAGNRALSLCILLFPIFLMIPFYASMLIYIDGYSLEAYYICLNYFFFLLLAIAAILLPGLPRLYLALLYAALALPIAITSAYVSIYRQMLDGNVYYFLWETNAIEAGEYVGDIIARAPGSAFFVAAAYLIPLPPLVYIIYKMPVLKALGLKLRFASSFVCLLVVAIAVARGAVDHNAAYRFYFTIADHQVNLRLTSLLSGKAAEKLEAAGLARGRPDDVRETYVVVIGESASRHHMSLYGYPRATDPRMSELAARDELLAFGNVSATMPATVESLTRAFTFMDQDSSWENAVASAVDIFNAVDFKTWWLSNNSVMSFYDKKMKIVSGNAGALRVTEPKNADLTSMTTRSDDAASSRLEGKDSSRLTFDGAILDWYDEALDSDEKKKIIFVHLKGSHVRYWYRFPAEFEKFRGSEGIEPETLGRINSAAAGVINDYDNSIHYTDYILSELIGRLRAAGGESWLMYFSDHGEEVYDFRAYQGRDGVNVTKYMVDVPFLLWFSDDYKKIRDVGPMKEYLDRPYELDNLIYTIMDLGHIETVLMNPAKSIVSDKFVFPVRRVHGVGAKKAYIEIEPTGLYNPKTYDEEKKLLEEYERK
ncbi:MAG: phosphoethanolamine transferase [Synergistaceae bacterium]|jgi:heptose-I-phosphate ethanolaminephosphotransferase|nr:phosphoethanolamine transferase [Synergistaceae bacterium]